MGLSKIKIEGISRIALRKIAKYFRVKMDIDNDLCVDVINLLDKVACTFDFTYQVVNDDDINEFHIPIREDEYSLYDHKNKIAYYRDYIYENAFKGDGFSRMTIMHEIAHYLIMSYISPIIEEYDCEQIVGACFDPEWQAKCLAGEILIPFDLTYNMQLLEIKEKCKVSQIATEYQYKKMHHSHSKFCFI